MSSIGSKDEFISQITRQSIFRHFFNPGTNKTDAPTSIPPNRLVCRGNRDLFFISNNLVRCCTINPNTINYKLLQVEKPYYEITSLAINKSGTLLALIGEEELDVVTLPANVMKGPGANVEGSSFTIKNLNGKIKKCLWQTTAANDSVLVVLNDKSQVKAYDLTKSLEVPIVDLDLKSFANFKNQGATSISFGSDKNLAGGLTLYVTTRSSIYAVYPFTSSTTKLATTKEAIDVALQDTKSAMELIQEKYPTNLTDIAFSPLTKAALKQFEYFAYLKNQLNGTLPTVEEVRDIHTDNPYKLFVVQQHLADFEGPTLQGPVATLGSEIQDIASFGENTFVSLLASVGDNAVVNYFAQLAPMLMKYKVSGEVSDESKEPTPAVQVPKYVKPKKGFGFVDNTEVQERALVKQTQSQASFWKEELTTLDLLHTDKLPVDASDSSTSNKLPTYLGGLDEDRFTIFMGSKKVVIADCAWVKDFVSDLVGDRVDDVAVTPHYGVASSEPEPILAFAYIKDEITSTGEYLVVIRKKTQDDLEVIQIVNNESEESTDKPKELLSPTDKLKSNPALIYNAPPPFSGLVAELQTLAKTNIAAGGLQGNSNLGVGGVENLESLNKLSVNTIQLASEYSIFGIKLQSRILSNLDSLKEQRSVLDKIKLQCETSEHGEDDKLAKLTEKQEKLDKRFSELQKKIFDALNRYNRNRSLPLSDAESTWFKEIDSVDNAVNSTRQKEASLTEKIEQLSLQVKSMVEASKEKRDDNSEITPVEQLELEQKLSKLKNWLVREDKAIQALKDKLTSSLKVLDKQ
ncbi:Nucleoporin NUP82 [Candida viswanathii]|uniref:Nucleoporin NUP82 n=1 Tax=Candida viswanathii TaxID=5486 RepID=A0A367YGT6_9ASCO|nr:Nucleoporin NUP82 [Candida viswanathii]